MYFSIIEYIGSDPFFIFNQPETTEFSSRGTCAATGLFIALFFLVRPTNGCFISFFTNLVLPFRRQRKDMSSTADSAAIGAQDQRV
jgi:hypothetical protein